MHKIKTLLWRGHTPRALFER